MRIVIHGEDYALGRLAVDASVAIAPAGRFFMLSRLGDEVTVACESRHAPPGEVQAGFRLIELQEQFGLDSVGIMAAITAPLAAAGISLFAFSVWSTDVLLVRDTDIDRAAYALAAAGHTVVRA